MKRNRAKHLSVACRCFRAIGTMIRPKLDALQEPAEGLWLAFRGLYPRLAPWCCVPSMCPIRGAKECFILMWNFEQFRVKIFSSSALSLWVQFPRSNDWWLSKGIKPITGSLANAFALVQAQTRLYYLGRQAGRQASKTNTRKLCPTLLFALGTGAVSWASGRFCKYSQSDDTWRSYL